MHTLKLSLSEAHELISSYLKAQAGILLITGMTEILYVGRAVSTGDAGDVLIMIKADGSVQVHTDRQLKPINWQPKVERMRLNLEEDQLILTAERFKPEEMLKLTLLEVHSVQVVTLESEVGKVLVGSEEDMRKALAAHPEFIETGLRILDEELSLQVGSIDLYAVDSAGSLVVIELKRSKATQEAVHQLSRYVKSVSEQNPGRTVRGLLAAPSISLPALKQLESEGLEFREITSLPSVVSEDLQGGLF